MHVMQALSMYVRLFNICKLYFIYIFILFVPLILFIVFFGAAGAHAIPLCSEFSREGAKHAAHSWKPFPWESVFIVIHNAEWKTLQQQNSFTITKDKHGTNVKVSKASVVHSNKLLMSNSVLILEIVTFILAHFLLIGFWLISMYKCFQRHICLWVKIVTGTTTLQNNRSESAFQFWFLFLFA